MGASFCGDGDAKKIAPLVFLFFCGCGGIHKIEKNIDNGNGGQRSRAKIFIGSNSDIDRKQVVWIFYTNKDDLVVLWRGYDQLPGWHLERVSNNKNEKIVFLDNSKNPEECVARNKLEKVNYSGQWKKLWRLMKIYTSSLCHILIGMRVGLLLNGRTVQIEC